MKTRYLIFLILAFLGLTILGIHPAKAEESLIISVAATKNAIKKYVSLPDSAKKVPIKTKQIPAEIETRCQASIMLMKNALMLGGINPQITFLATPNSRREREEVIKGYAVISAHLFNESAIMRPEFSDKIYISDPVLEDGYYEKGIFCLPCNHRVLNARNLNELKSAGLPLIGIHWHNDDTTLTEMGIEQIAKGPTTDSLFRMIKAGRADWIPLGFHNSKDLSVSQAGITLVPVKGIKISLRESRHYIVSKNHPAGAKVFQALQKGIKIMRKQGMIKKLLANGGFHCPITKKWKVLNSKKYIATKE
ncbi:hypothetical protein [Maridesulfovibrio sp.]|uniref:hypothetical protein n=1 Tax=Maridesulfovibrio sp. TaxID=2795000 RepID=UPI0039EE4C3A